MKKKTWLGCVFIHFPDPGGIDDGGLSDRKELVSIRNVQQLWQLHTAFPALEFPGSSFMSHCCGVHSVLLCLSASRAPHIL